MTRLLVVDDHAIVRSGIRRLLSERTDIDVLEAVSGEEALRAVQEQSLDLMAWIARTRDAASIASVVLPNVVTATYSAVRPSRPQTS